MTAELFPYVELNSTEQEMIAVAFTAPTVRKYLTSLANDAIKDIVFSEPAVNETAESYLRRVANVKGRLEALNTLLSISAS
jgi:hypothetical protein